MSEREPRSIGRRQMLAAGATVLTLAGLPVAASGRRGAHAVGAMAGHAPDIAPGAHAVRSLVLSGRVVDALERPVTGALVQISAGEPLHGMTAISDGDGRFMIDAPWAAGNAAELLGALQYGLRDERMRSIGLPVSARVHAGAAADSGVDSGLPATLRATVLLITA